MQEPPVCESRLRDRAPRVRLPSYDTKHFPSTSGNRPSSLAFVARAMPRDQLPCTSPEIIKIIPMQMFNISALYILTGKVLIITNIYLMF